MRYTCSSKSAVTGKLPATSITGNLRTSAWPLELRLHAELAQCAHVLRHRGHNIESAQKSSTFYVYDTRVECLARRSAVQRISWWFSSIEWKILAEATSPILHRGQVSKLIPACL